MKKTICYTEIHIVTVEIIRDDDPERIEIKYGNGKTATILKENIHWIRDPRD